MTSVWPTRCQARVPCCSCCYMRLLKNILNKSDTVGKLLPQKPANLKDKPWDHPLAHITRPLPSFSKTKEFYKFILIHLNASRNLITLTIRTTMIQHTFSSLVSKQYFISSFMTMLSFNREIRQLKVRLEYDLRWKTQGEESWKLFSHQYGCKNIKEKVESSNNGETEPGKKNDDPEEKRRHWKFVKSINNLSLPKLTYTLLPN